MQNTPADKRMRKTESSPAATGEREDVARVSIRKAMKRWRDMDAPARLLGRGLGMRELVDRVAREVGTSSRHVQSALKEIDGELA